MTVMMAVDDMKTVRNGFADALQRVAVGEYGVRARLDAKRADIERKQPLLRMAALLDEWSKWSKSGGGLGLGYGQTAAHAESVTYCISDEEAVSIERCIATLKGEGLSQGRVARERAEQHRVVICHHCDGISLNMLDDWLRLSRTTVQRRYWDGVEFIHERFLQIMKKSC